MDLQKPTHYLGMAGSGFLPGKTRHLINTNRLQNFETDIVHPTTLNEPSLLSCPEVTNDATIRSVGNLMATLTQFSGAEDWCVNIGALQDDVAF